MANDSALAKLILEIIPHSMHSIRRHMRFIAKSKMTIAQMRILANLYNGLKTTSELADYLGVSMPAMSKMIDGLVTRGMILREPSPSDRRHIHLSLSKLGLKTFLDIRKIAQSRVSDEVAHLTEKEKEELSRGLQILDKLHRGIS